MTLQSSSVSLPDFQQFFFIGGPCVIESEEHAFRMAESLKEITSRLGVPYVFKASYDKANRSSVDSFRGPGIIEGLRILKRIRTELQLPVLSDVHSVEEVKAAAEVVDIVQIPAFLCRQTDLLVAAGGCGKVVNVKKGQFMAPSDMGNVIAKVRSSGTQSPILLTERGTSFGYHNLVVDFRSFPLMSALGCPVIFDATHAVQLPGGEGNCSGGDRRFIAPLARGAAAAGVKGFFMEVHDQPEKALCDGKNSLPLSECEALLKHLQSIIQSIG